MRWGEKRDEGLVRGRKKETGIWGAKDESREGKKVIERRGYGQRKVDKGN